MSQDLCTLIFGREIRDFRQAPRGIKQRSHQVTSPTAGVGLMTTPPHAPFSGVPVRVQQAQSACLFCKGRKMKCDNQSPACSSCKKYGRAASCSLGNADSQQQRDYVAYLQASIEQLRSRLGKQTTLGNSSSVQQGPGSQASGDHVATQNEGVYDW